MTKKEHLLKVLPKIEYDLPLKELNLILEAMQAHTEEQLNSPDVSNRRELLNSFAEAWNVSMIKKEYILDSDIDRFIEIKTI
jgi:hypothetical protein